MSFSTVSPLNLDRHNCSQLQGDHAPSMDLGKLAAGFGNSKVTREQEKEGGKTWPHGVGGRFAGQ